MSSKKKRSKRSSSSESDSESDSESGSNSDSIIEVVRTKPASSPPPLKQSGGLNYFFKINTEKKKAEELALLKRALNPEPVLLKSNANRGKSEHLLLLDFVGVRPSQEDFDAFIKEEEDKAIKDAALKKTLPRGDTKIGQLLNQLDPRDPKYEKEGAALLKQEYERRFYCRLCLENEDAKKKGNRRVSKKTLYSWQVTNLKNHFKNFRGHPNITVAQLLTMVQNAEALDQASSQLFKGELPSGKVNAKETNSVNLIARKAAAIPYRSMSNARAYDYSDSVLVKWAIENDIAFSKLMKPSMSDMIRELVVPV